MADTKDDYMGTRAKAAPGARRGRTGSNIGSEVAAVDPELVLTASEIGLPRPVRDPSSERASAKAIDMPAPTAAARPTRNVVCASRVANAVANSGASVETEPSIIPARAGWTT